MEMQQLVAVAAMFVVAGTVKGVTGLGLPTVAMGKGEPPSSFRL